MLQMADFITTGKLIKKVKVDETSIDSPTVAIMDRLDPPGPATEERPKPAAPAKALWKMFSPPDEGFSAMMPSYVDSGRKTYHAENEGRAYWINYIDRPAAAPA